MRKADYKILENDEGYYGEILGFAGVYSIADTLEDCRNELAEVLEEWMIWLLLDNTDLPIVDGIDLNFKKIKK
jgi:predicted RNase H-like HicB family nuclease